MQDEPAGVTTASLTAALAGGWGIRAPTLRYLPVGAGGYHWEADGRWFLTVTDAAFAPLERALRTALSLHLPFVVAPIPARNGSPLRPLARPFNLAVFPLVDGVAGEFGPHPPADRPAVIDMLAALHRAPAGAAPPPELRLAGRASLAAGRASLAAGRAWAGGPYAAAARRLLREHASLIASRLAELDRLGRIIADAPTVVTHGEPHPGNILRTPDGPRLIDWDTVRLAPPERDLWFADDSASLARYAAATGHTPRPEALAFYRLMWNLADIAAYAAALRRPHAEGGDAEAALRYLRANLA
ncbi:phosphotransferase [Actinoplanes sp. CA-030573]|uniref:phosphotransferase n=1 Tax=Actinoplanes sp. CA-030573 TaxID=3239898 RepID=UPI003D8D719F